MKKEYYIYRYLYKNKIVYIGQTQSLDKRIQDHCSETRFFGLTNIEYFTVSSKEAANANENYYIAKYNPPLNRRIEKIKDTNLIQHDPLWVKYTNFINYDTPYIYNKRFLNRKFLLKQRFFYLIDYKGKYGLYVPTYEYEGLHFVVLEDVIRLIPKIKRFYHIKNNDPVKSTLQ